MQDCQCLPVSRLCVPVDSVAVKPPSRSVWKALEDWDWEGITDTSGHMEGSRKAAWKRDTKKEGREACGNLV